MPSEFISITLFIAPDGDFIRCDKNNMDHSMIVRPILRCVSITSEDPFDAQFLNKHYVRYTLKIPCTENYLKDHSPPYKLGDRFLVNLIKTFEDRGEAPWKT